MRSLFIKIFLWFWLAMTLVGIASLISAMTTESRPFFALQWLRFLTRPPQQGQIKPESGSSAIRWLVGTGEVIKLSGSTAAEIYERDGQNALLDYMERLQRSAYIRIFLFDAQGEELSGQTVPQEVNELMQRTKESGEPEFKRSQGPLLLAHRIPGTGGNPYIVVGRLSGKSFSSREPGVPVMHLVAILVTAGGVCYWLARYITTPIRKLRTAARRLAGGDLTVRVGSAVGNRQDEIADLSRDFDLMAERIESLMNAQHRLLRDISHELRSPLARLGIALELARQRSDHKASGALDRIGLEAKRLEEMIGQLLTLSRLESNVERKTPREPVDIARLVQEIAADADFEARGRNCTVRVAANGTCIISGTRELLRSAIENVTRNAIFYTAEGTEVQISLNCEQEEGGHHQVLIRVRDHGPGVPDTALTDIFRPFYRVGNARDRKTGGRGLGLAIAERAIRLHGGTITAAHAPDGGLVVTIHFFGAVSSNTNEPLL